MYFIDLWIFRFVPPILEITSLHGVELPQILSSTAGFLRSRNVVLFLLLPQFPKSVLEKKTRYEQERVYPKGRIKSMHYAGATRFLNTLYKTP